LRGLRSNNITLSGAEGNIQLKFEKNKYGKRGKTANEFEKSLARTV
jgi:hypothetical protein